MPRTHLRVLILVIAGWALLFAPGAAHGRSDATPVEPEHVGAAVLAPTMGTDLGTLTPRSGRPSCELERDSTEPPRAGPTVAACSDRALTDACLESLGCLPAQAFLPAVGTRAPPGV